MTIDIKVFDYGNVRVFEITGRVDSLTAVPLGEQLQRALKRDITQIVLDLGGVAYLTSAGIREIISAQQAAQSAGGDLRLAGPSDPVMDVLHMTGLDDELGIFASRNEAVHSFA
ncbi:MAG: STAS domain-containing protein [Anaerolineae bacterium]|nr:STAS domain-containing protein [Anaerolineae bacterium]